MKSLHKRHTANWCKPTGLHSGLLVWFIVAQSFLHTFLSHGFQSFSKRYAIPSSTVDSIIRPKVTSAMKAQVTFPTPAPVAEVEKDLNCDATGRYCWKPLESIDRRMERMYDSVAARDRDQTEFLQAFREVLSNLRPVFLKDSKYLPVLAAIAEPERVVTFRVAWLDDNLEQHVNRGYRVQFNSALGPFKGGLRFHPSVSLSIMKFLGFEQIFKNSLTGLSLGGGKGGSDFNPKGRSDAEVLRFCQSFMVGLWRYIGQNEDVPAGDIGVGAREIGYLYGQYKRLTSQFQGSMTGKDPKWGGSLGRPEATGFGIVYFALEVLKALGDGLEGKRSLVSGSGNVAQYCAQKLIEVGSKLLTMSDSTGFLYEEKGFTMEQLDAIKEIKNVKRRSLREYLKLSPTAKFYENKTPWSIPCDFAFPCATQNEIGELDADSLVLNGCKMVVEGSNMPLTNGAVNIFKANNIIMCPGKAANAGGVTVSGFEMAQNAMRSLWTFDEVDARLKSTVHDIFRRCKEAAEMYGSPMDLHMGADIAAFLKVADSLIEQGCV